MNPLINTSIRDPNPIDVCFVLYKLTDVSINPLHFLFCSRVTKEFLISCINSKFRLLTGGRFIFITATPDS